MVLVVVEVVLAVAELKSVLMINMGDVFLFLVTRLSVSPFTPSSPFIHILTQVPF